MEVSRHIDWLSMTFKTDAEARSILPVADWHYVGSGHHGYRTAYQDALSGAVIETDSSDASMGHHLLLTGETLHAVRSQFTDGDDGLIALCIQAGARTARIDLAINAHGGKLTVKDFYRAYKTGALTSPMRRAYYVEGINENVAGDTLYLGSPKSDRQLRIYNKGAEQGIVDGESWLRLELALRDLRAKAAAQASGDNGVNSTVSAHMDDVVHWQKPEFQSMVGLLGHAVRPIPRKASKTELWLRDQCAPALARVVAVNPLFMVDFMASFTDALDKLKSGD